MARKKWADLVGKFPVFQERSSEYQDGVNERARVLARLPMSELGDAYKQAVASEEAADDALRLAKAEAEAATRAIFDRMEQDNIEGVVVGGQFFAPTVEPYPQVKDKTTFMAWALEHHQGNLQMHASTLKALVKSSIEGEGDMPPGVDVYLKRKLTPRKA